MRFEVFDLFSGRAAPQLGPSVDLRVAVSAETPVAQPGPKAPVQMTREKHRKSFDFKAKIIQKELKKDQKARI